jgi:hypothetical protein
MACSKVALRPHLLSGLARILVTGVIVACVRISPASADSALPKPRGLPDARTWSFFSEKKVRSHLFYSVPGVADSIRVSDDPACCPIVSPSGRWVACSVFNSKAIESELVILSLQPDQWRPFPGYTVIGYQWSPDGLSLAGYGKRRAAGSVCFFVVQPLLRMAWFADSILVPEDYDFAWDSTSSRVAICRPGRDAHYPPLVQVLSLTDRKTNTLATVRSGVPTNPQWLPDGTLIVSRKLGAAGDTAAALRFPPRGR